MLPGARTPTGALYVDSAAPSSLSNANGGVSVEPDGSINTTPTVSATFANGVEVSAVGAMSIAVGGTITNYQQGLPFNSAGQLVCQLNQPENPDDAYVGGVRVGTVGGVYAVDTAPPVPHAFDSGFDSGFGV